MKTIQIISIIILAFTINSYTQADTKIDFDHALKLDTAFNNYFIGSLHNASRYTTLLQAYQENKSDLLFVKFKDEKHVDWVKVIKGGNTFSKAKDLLVDQNGNMYITGYFDNDLTFANQTLEAYTENDIFVAKYTPTGSLVWAKSLGADGMLDVSSVTIEENLNIYVSEFIKKVDGKVFKDISFDDLSLIEKEEEITDGSKINNIPEMVINSNINPYGNLFYVYVKSNIACDANIKISKIWGESIIDVNRPIEIGNNKIEIAMDDINTVAGEVYVITIKSGEYTKSYKVSQRNF